jgi:hypothetical protein
VIGFTRRLSDALEVVTMSNRNGAMRSSIQDNFACAVLAASPGLSSRWLTATAPISSRVEPSPAIVGLSTTTEQP